MEQQTRVYAHVRVRLGWTDLLFWLIASTRIRLPARTHCIRLVYYVSIQMALRACTWDIVEKYKRLNTEIKLFVRVSSYESRRRYIWLGMRSTDLCAYYMQCGRTYRVHACLWHYHSIEIARLTENFAQDSPLLYTMFYIMGLNARISTYVGRNETVTPTFVSHYA